MSKIFRFLLSPFTFVAVYGLFISYIYYQEHSLKASVESFKEIYFKVYETASYNSVLLEEITNHLTSSVNAKEVDNISFASKSVEQIEKNFEQMMVLNSSNESYKKVLNDFRNYFALAENVAKSMILGDSRSILIIYPKAEIVVELHNLVENEFNEIKNSSKNSLLKELNMIDKRAEDILFYGALLLLFHISLIILILLIDRKKWHI